MNDAPRICEGCWEAILTDSTMSPKHADNNAPRIIALQSTVAVTTAATPDEPASWWHALCYVKRRR